MVGDYDSMPLLACDASSTSSTSTRSPHVSMTPYIIPTADSCPLITVQATSQAITLTTPVTTMTTAAHSTTTAVQSTPYSVAAACPEIPITAPITTAIAAPITNVVTPSVAKNDEKKQIRRDKELDGWKRNIENTINKLDTSLTQMQETIAPLIEDNSSMREEIARLQTGFTDIQAVLSNEFSRINDAIEGYTHTVQSEMAEVQSTIVNTQTQTVNKLKVLENLINTKVNTMEDSIVNNVHGAVRKDIQSASDKTKALIDKNTDIIRELSAIAKSLD